MHKLLDTSTAAIATGVSPQRKLLKIDTGPYADRLVCLYNDSAGGLAVTWADSPYDNWTEPVTLITNSADYPLSACIDAQGNIYVVYIQQATLNLIFFKLAFLAGQWVTGAPVTILNSELMYYPVIARSNDSDLWCAFAYYDSGSGHYHIHIKSSTNDGLTWGSGPTDPGTALSNASAEMPYVNLNFIGADLYAVYSESRSNLYFQKLPGGSINWDSPTLIYSGDHIDSEFDCAVSEDMKLGIAFAPSEADRVYFREYDGVSLSGLIEVALVEARAPQLVYKKSKPFVFYAENAGNGFYLPKCAYPESGSFISSGLIPGIGFFDKILLYDAAAQTFEDKTAEASSENMGDIFHSQSNVLISSSGDCLYLGKDDRFFCVSLVLSTIGSGGAVVWEYFNGSNWVAISPYSGGYHLTETIKQVNLWQDIDSAPAGWQIGQVNSVSKFWVRCRVLGAFTVAPVGTQILAIPKADHLTQARGVV